MRILAYIETPRCVKKNHLISRAWNLMLSTHKYFPTLHARKHTHTQQYNKPPHATNFLSWSEKYWKEPGNC